MDKLDLILQKLDSIETRTISLEVGQQALLERTASLEVGQQALLERTASLEAGQKSLEVGQQSLLDRTASLEVGQQALLERTASLEAGQKSLEVGQQSLLDRTASLEAGQRSFAAVQNALISGQKELYQIVSAIRHRQELTDAKLDRMATDLQYMRVEWSFCRQSLLSQERRIRACEDDLSATAFRVDIMENSRSSEAPVAV